MSTHNWLGIEIRHLVALAAVARMGSFRGAAEELGYVQSAISQQIAHLERLVSQRLVERSRGAKQVRLTSAGEVLLEHIDEIVARFRAAQADLAAAKNPEAGELRVGLIRSVTPWLLPPIMLRMATQVPNMRLSLTDAATDAELFERVEHGTLDIAVAELPLEPGAFEYQELLEHRPVLVVPADTPLARGAEPPGVIELARLPQVALNGVRPHVDVENWLTAQGLTPRIALRANSEAAAQALVAAGHGVAILSRFSVDEDDPRIAVRELDGVLPRRSLVLYWHRDRRHVYMQHRFCAIASEVAQDLVASAAPTIDNDVGPALAPYAA